MIRALLLLVIASVSVAAQEPRAVAEEALAAWRAGDAKRLDAIAHPEFKKRCREARVMYSYLEEKPEKKKVLASASDAEIMALFCEALRAIVPQDDRVEHFDRFVQAVPKGELMIVTFESGWRLKRDPSQMRSTRQEIVLKKAGNDWRFLWSPAALIHVDLTWDPRE